MKWWVNLKKCYGLLFVSLLNIPIERLFSLFAGNYMTRDKGKQKEKKTSFVKYTYAWYGFKSLIEYSNLSFFALLLKINK